MPIRYLLRHLGWILRHPLNRANPLRTLGRYIGWHLGSRLLRQPVLYPFVDDLRIYVQTGFRGATGVVHFGLEEFEDMAFCAHLLRPGDRFADVGACFGTYSLLASGVAGADSIAFEPTPKTAHWLRENLRFNRLEARVTVVNAAVGRAPGTVEMTDDLLSANHIVQRSAAGEGNWVQVPLTTLDHELKDSCPTLIKIDVEGYEQQVLDGAAQLLRDPTLVAIIVEDIALGARYSAQNNIHKTVTAAGFRSYRYVPERRELIDLDDRPHSEGLNTLYVRDLARVAGRLSTARAFSCRGRSI